MRIVNCVVCILIGVALLATPAAAAGQPARTLEVWTHEFPPLQDAMTKKWIPEFEAAHPGVKVKMTAIPFAGVVSFDAKLLAALSGGGVSLLLGGLLGAVAVALHPSNMIDPVNIPVHLALYSAVMLIALGLPGLYARQAERAGRLGLIGTVVFFFGLVFADPIHSVLEFTARAACMLRSRLGSPPIYAAGLRANVAPWDCWHGSCRISGPVFAHVLPGSTCLLHHPPSETRLRRCNGPLRLIGSV